MKQILAATIVLTATGLAAADPIQLTGFGSSSHAPLAATIEYQITDDALRLTLTNTAVNAGPNNRITYFGFQLPTDDMQISFAGSDDTAWSVNNNAKLPGAGANTFNWLLETGKKRGKGGGDSVGLNLNESLTIDITTSSPLANVFDWRTWDQTTKDGYLFAAKFQTVGSNGADSGVAHQMGYAAAAIPEPTTMALMLIGGLLVMQRGSARESRQTASSAS
jgi:hypothetical protein